jgi:transcriptional regulator with XRE-family HTH domain
MTLLRSYLGSTLRSARVAQGRTLRDVAKSARVSLGYLSEVERGQKEASSELILAICTALDLSLSTLLVDIATQVKSAETPALTVVDDAA